MMETIKKIFQRFINFLGGWYQAALWLIIMFLIWHLVGISIKYSLPLVLFFWLVGEASNTPKAQKLLALLLKIIIVSALAFSLGICAFPRTKSAVVLAIARMDQKISGMTSKTDVIADDLWEKQKVIQGKKMAMEYNRLLAANRPQEAYDTLRKFNEAWNIKPVRRTNQDSIFSEKVTLKKGEPWFTDHRFKTGEVYNLKVESSPVEYLVSNGSNIIQPGTYPGLRVSSPAGQLSFRGYNNTVKITITYGY